MKNYNLMKKKKPFVADVVVLLQRGNDHKTVLRMKQNPHFCLTARHESMIASYRETEDRAAQVCIAAKKKGCQYFYASVSLN